MIDTMRMNAVLGVGLCLLSAVNFVAADDLTLDDIFPTDRVLDVQITVAEEDWDTIRRQSRNFFTALAETRKQEPPQHPYTYVEARVTIDGVEFPKVGIRKKGFIGSQSTTRPSLKIKLDHIDPEGGIEGLNNLTFNNNKQDNGLVSQFMGYALFNAAGSPAPRCAFASVTVNGKNLGIYSHVETMRKPLLKRGFGHDEGTLYEGTVVDFYDGWEGSFEFKRGADENARKQIVRLIGALNPRGGAVILGSKTKGRAWVPTSDKHDAEWMAPDFDDSGWVKGQGGAGYENDSGYESHLGPEFDFGEQLFEKGESVYLRFPFEVTDLSKIAELFVGMKYDDGFVAYINGHRVLSANAPDDPTWSSRATGPNDDRAAVKFQSFQISQHIDKLRKGANVLALHGLNVQASSSDMLIAAELSTSDTKADGVIKELVDLDAFYTFWAIEGLLGFWDGYSGNKNNFFFYLNPGTGKFHFLPWGADSLFVKFSFINPDRRMPLSVKTEGLIAHRLYQMPSGRARYRKALQDLLENHWDEEKLLAETDRIEAMLEPFTKDSRSHRRFAGSLERVREFIRNRRTELSAETADGMPIWSKPPSKPPLIPAGFGRGRFGQRDDDDKDEDKDDEDKDDEDEDEENREDIWSAAREGDLAAVKKHLESGVKVDAKDGFGATALNWAGGLGQIEVVRLLIEKGADVNALNGEGLTPLDDTERELTEEAVDFIAQLVDLEIDLDEVNAAKPKIAELLRKHGGKSSADIGKKSADLWAAAREGDVEDIKKHLAAGVDVNAKGLLGSTALAWAAGLGRIEAVKFLIEKGADVNAKDREGLTPLDGTARELEEAAAGFLLRFLKVKVDPKVVNAAKPEIAKLLRKHGGKSGSGKDK
jgi:spore coat protein CotH/ankyrin repeat protein